MKVWCDARERFRTFSSACSTSDDDSDYHEVEVGAVNVSEVPDGVRVDGMLVEEAAAKQAVPTEATVDAVRGEAIGCGGAGHESRHEAVYRITSAMQSETEFDG